MAAAIGAGLPIADPVASTVVDIGGGTTEVAVISLGSMVVWRSLPVGGYEMDDAIVGHVRRQHSLEIGEGRAEQLKIEIGSPGRYRRERRRGERARPSHRPAQTGGGERPGGAPGARDAGDAGDRRGTGDAGADPPELSADISERGIVLAGGGVLLRGFPSGCRPKPDSRCTLPGAATCVALGAGRCLDELETIARAANAAKRGGRRGAGRWPYRQQT